MRERLQKVLARAGVASRRHCEEIILEGRVRVNGRVVTELGVKVDPMRDAVEVDGKPLPRRKRLVYLLFHKPSGVITTMSDPEGRETVADFMPKGMPRAYPVGRLDWDTQGALVLTNDGALTAKLLHPSSGVVKVYRAKVRGKPDEEALQKLREGVEIEPGVVTAPAVVEFIKEQGKYAWVRLIVTEGKNHQIKLMLDAVGHRVVKLRRDSFAGLDVSNLPIGKFRVLTKGEINDLRKRAGLPPLPPAAFTREVWHPRALDRSRRDPRPAARHRPGPDRGRQNRRGPRDDRGYSKGPRDDRGYRGQRDGRGYSKGPRDDRGYRGQRDDRGHRGQRDDRGYRGQRDDRGYRGQRDDRGYRGQRDGRQQRGQGTRGRGRKRAPGPFGPWHPKSRSRSGEHDRRGQTPDGRPPRRAWPRPPRRDFKKVRVTREEGDEP